MTTHFLPISPTDAQALLTNGQALLIDVREWPDTLQTRIPGSHNIPFSTFNASEVTALGSPDQPVIIHCYHGIRSQAACLALLAAHPDLIAYNLTGGFAAWQEAGLPVS